MEGGGALTTDSSGSFYTDQPVGWGQGLYVVVGTDGRLRSMQTPLTEEACNRCHDAANRIRVETSSVGVGAWSVSSGRATAPE